MYSPLKPARTRQLSFLLLMAAGLVLSLLTALAAYLQIGSTRHDLTDLLVPVVLLLQGAGLTALLALVYRRMDAQVNATEQEHATTSHALQEHKVILDNSLVGICYLRNREVVRCNSRFAEMLAYDPADLVGQPITILFPHDELFDMVGREAYEALLSGQSYHLERLVLQRNGQTFWCDIAGKAIDPNDMSQGSIWIFADITERKQIEDNLSKARQQFQAAFEQATIGMMLISPQGHVITANRALEDMLGYSEAELKIMTMMQITHPEDMETAIIRFQQALDGSISSYQQEERYIHRSGKVVWALLKTVLVRDAQGKPWQFISQLQDITEQKAARESLEHVNEMLEQRVQERTSELAMTNEELVREIAERARIDSRLNALLNEQQVLIETATIGIAWVRYDAIARCNPAFERMLDCEPGELHPDSEVDTQSRTRPFIEFTEEAGPYIEDGSVYHDEKQLTRKDGHLFWVSISGRLIDRRMPDKGAIWVAEDITERKRAEQELLRTLRRERELSDLKSRFVTLTSHEFRTPLTSILSSAEMLEHYHDRWPLEKQLVHMQRIQQAANHMTSLLDDVLTLSRQEAGKQEFRPTRQPIAALFDKLLREAQAGMANQGGHKVTFLATGDCGGEAMLDEKVLRSIVLNLLSNAVKYSPADKPIRFELHCSTDRLSFSVTDEGIGIPQEDMERLFDAFFRATNIGNIQGTGLGLAITRNAVKTHQGEITVTSEVGKGTTFNITIPRELEEEVAS